jgi:hypothetical protein
MPKKKVVKITINMNLTMQQEILLFKIIPQLQIIQSTDTLGTTMTRKDYVKDGLLKPRY